MAIYGYPTRDVGNPVYIVYGISVNKLIYREQRDDKPYILPTLLLLTQKQRRSTNIQKFRRNSSLRYSDSPNMPHTFCMDRAQLAKAAREAVVFEKKQINNKD